MSRHLYDRLALGRMDLIKKYNEKKYREVDQIYCQLYDLAEVNKEKPGELPKSFLVSGVRLKEKEFKKVFDDLGLKVSYKLVELDPARGDKYKITLS